MNYKIICEEIDSKYLSISALFENVNKNSQTIQLPAWRPGRYEIQNFAQFIRKVQAFSSEGSPLEMKKVSKDSWSVQTAGNEKIRIEYEFYADIQNAGGSFIDKKFFYLNPINCLVYIEEKQNEACELEIEFKHNKDVACGLTHVKNKNSTHFKASSFHDLVDSPIMISDKIQHQSYEASGCTFHIWIKGNTEIPFEQLIKDFKKFTEEQINIFGEFPEPEYHFMLWLMPNAFYHGVEHRNSTMMTLGPISQPFEEFYTEILGLASHELFHTWNVKRIRPIELMPYDYSRENYFETCFVAEGLTTFYGDWILFRSNAFSQDQFTKEFEATLRRHFENADTASESLLQSSYDLWLDGYKKGIPDRKVSVYHKGAIAALILHHEIQMATKNTKGLDDVMKSLWDKHGKPFIGYSLKDYIEICEDIAGVGLSHYFEKVIAGSESIWDETQAALSHIGFKLSKSREGYARLTPQLKR